MTVIQEGEPEGSPLLFWQLVCDANRSAHETQAFRDQIVKKPNL
jgi:hypothetical protein